MDICSRPCYHKTMRPILRILLLLWFCSGIPLPAPADPEVLEDQPTTLVSPPFWHTPFGIHRATPELLHVFVGDRTRFDNPQGLACGLLFAQSRHPESAVDFQLTVLGVNRGRKEIIYNPDLLSLALAVGPWQAPQGIALAPDGRVWVADPGGGTATAGGVFGLRRQNAALAAADPLLPPPGGWASPWGVAADSQGTIYVTDRGRDQILIYSASGVFQRSLGPRLSPGITLKHPEALAVTDSREPWSYYHDDFIFVGDQDQQRLLRIGPEGEVQAVHTSDPGKNSPMFTWMALDYYENVWVTDAPGGRIHKFNRHLQPLQSVGKQGRGDGYFDHPTGIAIHRHFGQIFVAEAQGAQYLWIGADADPVEARRRPEDPARIQFEFWLTEPAHITLRGRTPLRADPWMICEKAWFDSGRQQLTWTPPAPDWSSPWAFTLRAEATYSSARHLAKEVRFTLPAAPELPAPR